MSIAIDKGYDGNGWMVVILHNKFFTRYSNVAACIVIDRDLELTKALDQLVIGERVVTGMDQADQDWRHFKSLCEELRSRDRLIVRGVSRFIQSQLQPEDSDIHEPPMNTNVRGHPRNSSTCLEESAWLVVRWRLMSSIPNEISTNTFYQQAYWNGLDAACRRIDWCVMMCFGLVASRRSLMSCVTLLPWIVNTKTTQPLPELVIAHLEDYQHYICLEMQHDFPIPPIHVRWFQLWTPSVHVFEHAYASGRPAWEERL
ncbi:Alpha-1 3-galactosidase A [Bienertia sinuspersici]